MNTRSERPAVTTSPTLPTGVLELSPAEQAIHDDMLDRIRRGFRRHGFPPIETPVFERSDVLLTKMGGETERQVYFVQSAGSLERDGVPDLALRFDLTVPLARYVAAREHELVFPFRRSQIQRVYRGERPQRGRFREFYQCDIDVIDRESLSLRHDAEVAAAAISILNDLEVGSVTLRINNRRLMRGLLSQAGVDTPDAQTATLREIDKLEKRGRDAVAQSLSEQGMDPSSIDSLLRWTTVQATGPDDIAAALAELPGGNEEAAAELLEVVETMQSLGVPADQYMLDLSIARGLDYYTGTVFETTLDEFSELGSICSGGRYDDLAGQYTTTHLPGVGISIGFTRLFSHLLEAGRLPDTRPAVEVAVALLDEGDLPHALELATRLRRAGIATESQMVATRLGKQLKAADRRGTPIMVIAGEDERARGVVAVKDLRTGDQADVELERLVSHVQAKLNEEL